MSIRFNLCTSLAFAMIIFSQQASAFSVNTLPLKVTTISHTKRTSLNAVQVNNLEDDPMALLFRARDCADSESCSIDMANDYLKDVVHMQSGCAAGTLSGVAVCDDALLITEVVASLRSKIERESHRASRQFLTAQAELGELTLTSMNQSDSGVSLNPVAAITSSPFRLFCLGVALFYLGTLLSMVNPVAPGVVPFTGQEWWWAARDGYLGDMISESVKYGGFMTDNPGNMIASAFTGQEWWWAVRDGYVGDIISENMKYGGLMSENVAESTALPFTSQEWWWAVRDRYVDNMISHAFKNGGL
eukprot:CAMPEP_0172520022 /NCGR_PEP_ID=MMETSP1066-20121228/291756_1 /TAXON_ID=671091 /ORGANISM="Coscinodiscus wailesii, Strain CCMP2513" /LENGTH=302 /DNA_ID=CAMNT_0013302703 /DNA_START=418 /DNA_END=1326 /DNA_ORIENTATION=+